jgi:DNA-directed RNA polymerase subunit alpha
MITKLTTYPPIKTTLTKIDGFDYQLTISPLLPGFGHTLGNSLRRLFLSSIPGFAVTRIRINDLTHEYQAVKDVKEDALDVLLNLKSLRVKIVTDDEKVTIKLKNTKGGDITAKDFDSNSAVEILNKELYICHLNEGAKLEIEVEVSRGYGYVSYEKQDLRGNQSPTHLLIDAAFSPVRNVIMTVDQVRVGDQTNYNKLNIAFSTDGTVTGEDVTSYALKLIVELFQNIESSFEAVLDVKEAKKLSTKAKKTDVAEVTTTIDLSAKILRILEKNGISSVEELIARRSEVAEFAGLGGKSLDEIETYIKKLN